MSQSSILSTLKALYEFHFICCLQALGFARLLDETWSYTPQTEDIVRQYMEKFPEVFDMLGNHRDSYNVVHINKNNGYVIELNFYCIICSSTSFSAVYQLRFSAEHYSRT